MITKHSPSWWKKIGTLLYPTIDAGISVGGTQAGQSKIASGLVVNEDGGNTANDDLRAETVNNPNAFVVDASDDKVLIGVNTQIGTTSAPARLNVKSTGTSDIVNLYETDGVEVFTVLENGNTGINNTNPRAKLDVNGTDFPVGKFERTTTALNGAFDTLHGVASAFLLKTSTSGDMGDGFGGGFVFGTQDNTLISDNNYIARFYARRDGADNTGMFQFWTGAGGNTPSITIKGSGNFGVSTVSPTAKLSVSEKSAMNELGGFMIKLTNKTGANSVKGTVVYANPAVDNAFEINPIDGDMPIGVVYESGIADGSECWVVVSGIAEVLLVNSVATTRSYIAYSSGTTAGRIDTAATVPAAITHFREIGHTIESKGAGTNVLVKCVLHFN